LSLQPAFFDQPLQDCGHRCLTKVAIWIRQNVVVNFLYGSAALSPDDFQDLAF
jgi:hypothetical protein